MIDIILITIVFYVIQLLLPMCFSLGKVPLMSFLSTANESYVLTKLSQRTQRAVNNFKESLPIFLVLCVLSIILNIDNVELATYWIVSRLLYLTLGIMDLYKYPFIRTILWFISIGILLMMGCNLYI